MKAVLPISSIESLLRERIGFCQSAGGNLAGCLRRRMQACGMDESGYLSLLFSSESEQQELIEEVLVFETWFFRDFEPFAYLRKYASEKLPACSPNNPLNVLSLPASTGEEPYSIAMTLMEAGFTPDLFRIRAVDLSERALGKAAEALYGASSFREKDDGLRRKYFEECDALFRLREEARNAVRFERGNVLREGTLGPGESCDVVFFRNLLIYLDRESRDTAVRNVGRVLKKGGLLVLGYAEPQHLFFPDYVPADHARSYASIKPAEKPEEKKKSPIHATAPAAVKKARTSKRKSGPATPFRKATLPPFRKGGQGGFPLNQPLLFRARELADAGMLADAEKLAGKCIESDSACVEAHYLLAMTALARGDEKEAAGRLNRVLYLDPDHDDALLHLSLLMERFGRKDQAALYRKRISRPGKVTSPGE